jgi:hypothetical protein
MARSTPWALATVDRSHSAASKGVWKLKYSMTLCRENETDQCRHHAETCSLEDSAYFDDDKLSNLLLEKMEKG